MAKSPSNPPDRDTPDEGFDLNRAPDRDVAERLVKVIEPVEAPASVWDRVARAIQTERDDIRPPVRSEHSRPHTAEPAAASPGTYRIWPWAGMAAAAGVGLAVGSFFLGAPLADSELRDQLAAAQNEAESAQTQTDRLAETLAGRDETIRLANRTTEALNREVAEARQALAMRQQELDRQRDVLASRSTELTQAEAEAQNLRSQIDELETDLAVIQRVLASDETQIVKLSPPAGDALARGRAIYNPAAGDWRVFLSELTPLEQDRVYQFWFITADERVIPSDTFVAGSQGQARLNVRPPMIQGTLAAVAVSDEPPGGSQQPTGTIRLVGPLQ